MNITLNIGGQTCKSGIKRFGERFERLLVRLVLGLQVGQSQTRQLCTSWIGGLFTGPFKGGSGWLGFIGYLE